MNPQIRQIRTKILPILKKYSVRKSGIFGSYAAGRQTKNSDIDILVDIGTDLSLIDFVGLKLELEQALGKKVDLVEYGTIKPLLKDKILSQQVQLQ